MADSLRIGQLELDDELGGIPEIDLTIRVRPYMYEPVRRDDETDSESESSEDSESEPEVQSVPPVDEWCSCEQCSVMPTERECRCCLAINEIAEKVEVEGLKCITEHEGFLGNCMNRYVIETSFFEYIQDNGQLRPNELVHEVYRYMAYRRFTRWIWQILGKRNRRVLPSCVVTKIRENYPSQQYCGFKYPV